MCELVENYARQVAEEEAAKAVAEVVEEAAVKARKEAEESARSLFENGVDFGGVCHSIKTLSREELLIIYEEVKNKN